MWVSIVSLKPSLFSLRYNHDHCALHNIVSHWIVARLQTLCNQLKTDEVIIALYRKPDTM